MKIGVIGASGFVGGEMLRLLISHPKVEISMVTSRQYVGEYVSRIQPASCDQLSPNDFPKGSLKETAMVCFESDVRTDRVYVFLDRYSGEFVTIMYAHGIGRSAKV